MDVLFAGDWSKYVLPEFIFIGSYCLCPGFWSHHKSSGKTIFLFPLDADTSDFQVYTILPSFGCIKLQNHGEKRRNDPFKNKKQLIEAPPKELSSHNRFKDFYQHTSYLHSKFPTGPKCHALPVLSQGRSLLLGSVLSPLSNGTSKQKKNHAHQLPTPSTETRFYLRYQLCLRGQYQQK